MEEKDLESIVEKEERSFFRKTGKCLSSILDKVKGFAVEHNVLSTVVAGTIAFSTVYGSSHLMSSYFSYTADVLYANAHQNLVFVKKAGQNTIRYDPSEMNYNAEHNMLFYENTICFNVRKVYDIYKCGFDIIPSDTAPTFKDYFFENPFRNFDPKLFASMVFSASVLSSLFINSYLKDAKYRRRFGMNEDRGTMYDYYKNQRLMQKIKMYSRNPLDFLFDNPLLSTAGFLAYRVMNDLDIYAMMEKTLVKPSAIFCAGADIFVSLLFYLGVHSFSPFLHSTRSRFMKVFLGLVAEKLGKEEFAFRRYNSGPSSPLLRSKKAKLLMKWGKLEDALEEHTIALSQIGGATTPPDFPAAIPKHFMLSVADVVESLGNNPISPIYHTTLATTFFELNYPEKAIEVLEEMVQKNPGIPELHCYAASFCEMINKSEDAQGYLRRAIEVFLSMPDPERRFKPIPGSRNEVMIIDSAYMGKIFVLKRNPLSGGIRKERAVTLLSNAALRAYIAQEGLGIGFSTIEQSLSFLEHNNQFYHVKKRKPGLPLDKKYAAVAGDAAAALVSDINSALASLAKLHGLVSPHTAIEDGVHYAIIKNGHEQKERIPVFDFAEEVKRRFISRVGHHESEEELLEQVRALVCSELGSMPSSYLIHGDFYDTNVLEGGVLLDLERASIGNPVVDLASFLGNPGYKGVDRNGMLCAYLSCLAGFSDVPFSEADLLNAFPTAELLDGICQIGSKLNRGDLSAALQYRQKVVSGLTKRGGKLAAAFREYVINAPNRGLLTIHGN